MRLARIAAIASMGLAPAVLAPSPAAAQPAPSSTAAPAESSGLVLVSEAPPGAPSVDPRPARSEVPAYVMGGVGGVFVLAGGALIGVSLVLRSAQPGSEASQAMLIGGVPMAILGGLSIAGAVAYTLWPAPSRAPSGPAWRVLPAAIAGGGGLVCVGSF